MFESVSPKVDFPKLEEKILNYWEEKKIVEKYLHKNDSSKEKFSFLDGPITANNPMGVHHAWGRTYKDLWQRFFNMKGKRQRFQNGFDEQGLWVEVEVEKELGFKNKKDIENLVPNDKFKSLEKFINLCKERVSKFSKIQTEQSKRLGYFMDWDNSYHTSSDENNYAIWNFLKIIHGKGWLYKGRDAVPWCPRCGTAISQHEILTEEYKELKHETVFFKLLVKNKDFSLLAWTTTPWTIPANVALAVNPNFNYKIWKNNKTGDKILVLREDSLPSEYEEFNRFIKDIFSGSEWTGIKSIKGEDLVNMGLKYIGPFDDLSRVRDALRQNPKTFHSVVSAEDLVVASKGTGLLHLAPGAGEEDFKLAKEKNLAVIDVIDEEANYLEDMGEFSFKNAKKHPEIIIDYLRQLEGGRFLFKTKRITHRYPTCWRCKEELVWRVVDEWYIGMDMPKSKVNSALQNQKSKTYREQMVEAAKKINWLPKWGLDRELDWLNNMHDWLISKKRYWGLALPIWECGKCKNFEVIGSKEELRERSVLGFEQFKNHSPHRPWVDSVKIKCQKCDSISERIPDVGNPWLDAGIVPFSTMPKDWFPADFITESFPGQFKNWFYSLIAMSTVLANANSFKTVLGYASVRDEKGEEMHKSKGNAIEFNEAAEKIGVDVMRWMYVRQDPEFNLNFGIKAADQIRRQFHLMLWNIYNFFVLNANVDKWERKNQKGKSSNVLDKWMLSRLNRLVETVSGALISYDAFLASNAIEGFANDLSLWYVRRCRNRVGQAAPPKNDKNFCYETLWKVLVTVSQITAPLMPFLSEEIYRNLTGKESVHLAKWPKTEGMDEKLEKEMETVRKLCEVGHAKRKELGIKVRQPLAEFRIQNLEFRTQDELIELIKDELNVKKVEFIAGKGELKVEFDTKLTKELKDEGEAREIVRQIQTERKRIGTSLNEGVNVILPDWPKTFESHIKKKAMVNLLKKGPKFEVKHS